MRWKRRIILVLLLALCSTINLAQAKPFTHKLIPLSPKFDNSFVFKATIEHSESLPPVPPSLRVGAAFDKSILKLTSDNSWFQLPDWMAGTWKEEQETEYFKFDFVTGATDNQRKTGTHTSEQTLGWQRDRLGGIWQYRHAPFVTLSDMGSVSRLAVVKECEPLYVSWDKVVLRFRSIHAYIDKDTSRVVDSNQSESIQTYTAASEDGFMKCVGSIKSFDEHGRASKLTQSVAGLTRIDNFSNWDSYEGTDIHALFKEYLLRRGLKDRMP